LSLIYDIVPALISGVICEIFTEVNTSGLNGVGKSISRFVLYTRLALSYATSDMTEIGQRTLEYLRCAHVQYDSHSAKPQFK